MFWRSRICIQHWGMAFMSNVAAYVQRKDRRWCRIWCLVLRLHGDADHHDDIDARFAPMHGSICSIILLVMNAATMVAV